MSAPYFPELFGKNIERILEELFRAKANLFSSEHVYFIKVGGLNAGMILAYDWQSKNRENLRTGILLFQKLGLKLISKIPVFLRFNSTVGAIREYEYYISNIAPAFRGQGYGC